MNEPAIQFPVICPRCGREELQEYPIAEVAAALLTRPNRLRLYAACHQYHWDARPSELAQIREYFTEWMRGQPVSMEGVEPTEEHERRPRGM